jgi:hypothetical protein
VFLQLVYVMHDCLEIRIIEHDRAHHS